MQISRTYKIFHCLLIENTYCQMLLMTNLKHSLVHGNDHSPTQIEEDKTNRQNKEWLLKKNMSSFFKVKSCWSYFVFYIQPYKPVFMELSQILKV